MAKTTVNAKLLSRPRPRNFGIGRDIQPKRDLTRYVSWPKYVRLQRQRKVLYSRLRTPPSISQFKDTLDKNTSTKLFHMMKNYRPESGADSKSRLAKIAEARKGGAKAPANLRAPEAVKYGVNHVTDLIESRKAKMVVIASDVDPIELVVWMPALCKRMGVPYCIIGSKAKLGHYCRQKTVTCVALTDIRDADKHAFTQLSSLINKQYT